MEVTLAPIHWNETVCMFRLVHTTHIQLNMYVATCYIDSQWHFIKKCKSDTTDHKSITSTYQAAVWPCQREVVQENKDSSHYVGTVLQRPLFCSTCWLWSPRREAIIIIVEGFLAMTGCRDGSVGLSVGRLVHHCRTDRPNNYWMNCHEMCTVIPRSPGDQSYWFLPAPPAGQSFHLSCKKYPNIYMMVSIQM